MHTHMIERPQKCPVIGCRYNERGFIRKDDRIRHTLGHCEGTMVCGFCPRFGVPKNFCSAELFKRRLTYVHGVGQLPPSRRTNRLPFPSGQVSGYGSAANGRCSICSGVFVDAQDLYYHLNDCVSSFRATKLAQIYGGAVRSICQ